MENTTICKRVLAVFLCLVIGLVACLTFLPQVNAETTFSNVQVSIQTSSALPDYFTVSVFNSTGILVVSTQTHFPAASFELPNGNYIFVVTADVYGRQIYYSPVPAGAATGASSSTGSTSPGSIGSTVAPSLPYYVAPILEYGYSSQTIAGSAAFTIQTRNVTTFPTNTVTVKASYVNGTPAAGATVSASVLGSYYYWGYQPEVVTWATTQTDGIATLITPVAPLQIDVWSWLPVNLPISQTTTQVNIGGETVNVTVYWQPTYVGLAASTLIVPPQTSASVTLLVQQPNYWVTPYASGTTLPAVGAPSSSLGVGSVPAQVAQQQQGNPLIQNYQPTQTPSPIATTTPAPTSSPAESSNGTSILILVIAVAVAIAIAIISLFIAIRTRKGK